MSSGSPAQKFLRFPEVCELTGKSRAGIYAAMKKNQFPAPVRIGARSVAWPESVISDWQEACIKAAQSS
jgi:prophage regulatory protein